MVGMPITAVERETGLSKDLLRKWEQRYGFPLPARDANGDRCYSAEQVARLRLLRRLLDQGHRPGRLMALDEAALLALATPVQRVGVASPNEEALAQLIALLKENQQAAIQHFLHHQQSQSSLREFVTGFLSEANRAVGDAWMHGQLTIAEEHLYTEQVKRLLRQIMHGLPTVHKEPRCLLTTVSGELHGLGLLMVEVILRLAGLDPVNLGPNLPLAEIRAAALAHQSQVVLLSFSSAFPANEAKRAIIELRQQLPDSLALWCGGSGTRQLRRLPAEVLITQELDDLERAVASWRSRTV